MPTESLQTISSAEYKRIIAEVQRLVSERKIAPLFLTLKPLLDSKCAFPKLDRIGKILGECADTNERDLVSLLDKIVEYNAMGGYVIVGQALVQMLETNFARAMKLGQKYIEIGACWYVCDIIGERCFGQALNRHFESALPYLRSLLNDKNDWVKRSAGVAIHLFVKRNKTDQKNIQLLLQAVEPHIEEKNIDVVKGIGWGLKTIGKYHPDLMDTFLRKQFSKKRKLSGLMLSKATTYFAKSRRVALASYARTLPG